MSDNNQLMKTVKKVTTENEKQEKVQNELIKVIEENNIKDPWELESKIQSMLIQTEEINRPGNTGIFKNKYTYLSKVSEALKEQKRPYNGRRNISWY